MANMKIYKIRSMQFCLSCHRFRDTKVSNLLPSKVGQVSWNSTFAIVYFDGKYQKLIVPCISALDLTVSDILTFEMFDLEKIG